MSDCDCPECAMKRIQRLLDWLDGEPGPWATFLLFITIGLIALLYWYLIF